MKVGFTPTEAYNMFRSLRREVFDYFNYDYPLTYAARPSSSGIFGVGTIAQTDFSNEPDVPWYPYKPIVGICSGIRMNADYLPYVYEDELLVIFLHELAHVIAGLDAGHNGVWQDKARQVGAIPSHFMVIRNWRTMFAPGHPSWDEGMRSNGPTMDTFVGSL